MFADIIAEVSKERFFEYLQKLSVGVFLAFKGAIQSKRYLLHFLAIAVSIPLVLSGWDWAYYLVFYTYPWLQIFFFPAVILGALIPIFLPAYLYLYGINEKDQNMKILGIALVRAAVVGLFWSSAYKAITGRVGPKLFEGFTGDISRDFAFGILRKGVFEGWPSGHTTIAFAMAIVFYRFKVLSVVEEKLHPILKYRKYAILYAMYIGFGISTNIHWLSDFAAGVFIGIAVGLSSSETVGLENSENAFSEIEYKRVIYILVAIFVFTIVQLDYVFSLF